MSIGENIQFYRKRLGLTQEELGQKLLVSRQTVSFWENVQTVPTIDNLMRLKEIFGVTVDEILTCENNTEEKTPVPLEKYCFEFSEKELSEVRRFTVKGFVKHIAIAVTVLLLLILTVFYANSESSMIFAEGFTLGIFFLYFIICLKSIRVSSRVWKTSRSKILQSRYEYTVCNSNSFNVTVSRSGETVRISKFSFSDIERIQDTGKLVLLTVAGQIFILRKSELTDNSAFFFFMNSDSGRQILQAAPNKLITLSRILFVSTLLSILAALFSVNTAAHISGLFIENMWIMFLFTPIPAASVVLGSVLKSKGYKYKKNTIAGIIMLLLLCVYGSFTFMFAGM